MAGWAHQNKINVLERLDLNPVENLWNEPKNKVHEKETLYNVCQDECIRNPSEYCKMLTDGSPAVLTADLKANGLYVNFRPTSAYVNVWA